MFMKNEIDAFIGEIIKELLILETEIDKTLCKLMDLENVGKTEDTEYQKAKEKLYYYLKQRPYYEKKFTIEIAKKIKERIEQLTTKIITSLEQYEKDSLIETVDNGAMIYNGEKITLKDFFITSSKINLLIETKIYQESQNLPNILDAIKFDSLLSAYIIMNLNHANKQKKDFIDVKYYFIDNQDLECAKIVFDGKFNSFEELLKSYIKKGMLSLTERMIPQGLLWRLAKLSECINETNYFIEEINMHALEFYLEFYQTKEELEVLKEMIINSIPEQEVKDKFTSMIDKKIKEKRRENE